MALLLGVPCRCQALDVLEILDVEGKPPEIRAAPASFGHNI